MCDHLNEGGDQATLARLYQDCVESHQRLNGEVDDLERWLFDVLDYQFDGDTYLEVVEAIVSHNLFLQSEVDRLRGIISSLSDWEDDGGAV